MNHEKILGNYDEFDFSDLLSDGAADGGAAVSHEVDVVQQ
jgi:hypothetical protein